MSEQLDAAIRKRAKVMMRRRFRAQRQALSEKAAQLRSLALCNRLLSLEVIRTAINIALFWPMQQHREVDLRGLHHALALRHCALWYPRVIAKNRELHFHRVDDSEALVKGPFGTLEPPADAPRATTIDVVIVPGLVFDAQGYRIGYGAGFYDRALPLWCPPARAIGVAFDFQLASEIPQQPWDVAVDMVVTDQRELIVSRKRG